jgi:hypothetical protein
LHQSLNLPSGERTGTYHYDMAVESIARSHSAVGPGIGALKADAARTILKDALAVEFYRQHPEKNYPYEVLQGNEIVKEVVDLWLQVGLSISRRP